MNYGVTFLQRLPTFNPSSDHYDFICDSNITRKQPDSPVPSASPHNKKEQNIKNTIIATC